jgi:hypothetical protein
MRLITAIVTLNGLRGRILLVNSAAHPDGWPVIHDRTEDMDTARAALLGAVKHPGRIDAR